MFIGKLCGCISRSKVLYSLDMSNEEDFGTMLRTIKPH